MMPKSGKGGGRNRAQKKAERYSVPITPQLAARLKATTSGRAGDAPLLTQRDGSPWPKHPGQHTHRLMDKIVSANKLSPEVTMYALRHSSIVRMLLQNVPIRLVASLHNTSVAMIEKTYARHITEHDSDAISRKALLQHEPPSGNNIVALAS
jgi:integrase